MKKMCIVTTPRCGSQLCEKLIANLYHPPVVLGEYFENSNLSTYRLDGGHIVNVTPSYSDQPFPGPSNSFMDRLSLLGNSIDQNITIRIFFYPIIEKNISIYEKIFKTLTELGFEFIHLTRDFEKQVLSFLIANAYEKVLGKDIWHIGTIADTPVKIPDHAGFVLHPSIVYYNQLKTKQVLQQMLPKSVPVFYDTMHRDIAAWAGEAVDTLETDKTTPDDPYDIILNADEVRSWIKPFKDLL